MGLVPVGDQAVHGPLAIGRPGADLTPQQLGEQVVIAERRVLRVESQHEQVVPLELAQDVTAVVAARHRIAGGRREHVEERGVEQELPDVAGQGLEHLADEELGDRAVGAGELGDEGGPLLGPLEGEGRQLEAGGPSLGAGEEERHVVRGQVVDLGRPQERVHLVRGEGEIGLAQLEQRALGPQSMQAQPGVGACPEHQVEPSGCDLGQLRQRPPQLRAGEDVHVVEHEAGIGTRSGRGQVVGQGGDGPIVHAVPTLREQVDRFDTDLGHQALERGGHVGPEANGIVVVGIQRDPAAGGRGQTTGPAAQHHGLAGSGGGGHERERSLPSAVEQLPEAGSLDVPMGQAGRDELGRQDVSRWRAARPGRPLPPRPGRGEVLHGQTVSRRPDRSMTQLAEDDFSSVKLAEAAASSRPNPPRVTCGG